MSDLVGRPDNPEQQINSDGPEESLYIPHSGNLGLDQPVDILNTPLHEAPVHPIPDTIEEFVALKPGVKEESETEPLSRKTANRWLKPVGCAVVALGLAAGAYLAGGRSDTSDKVVAETPVEEPGAEQLATTLPPAPESTTTMLEAVSAETFEATYMTEFSQEGAQKLFNTFAGILSFNRIDLLDTVLVNPNSDVGSDLKENAAAMAGQIANSPRWQQDVDGRSWIKVESFSADGLNEEGDECAQIQLRRKFFSHETIEIHKTCFRSVTREQVNDDGSVEPFQTYVIAYIPSQEIISE